MSTEADTRDACANAIGRVAGRVVYGYLRADVANELDIAALRRELEHFCRMAGYRLVTVFVDRRVPGDQVKRAGLGGLLDVLALPGAHGVVVLSLDHVATTNAVLAVLRRSIRRTGSEVIVVHEVEDTTKADGA